LGGDSTDEKSFDFLLKAISTLINLKDLALELSIVRIDLEVLHKQQCGQNNI